MLRTLGLLLIVAASILPAQYVYVANQGSNNISAYRVSSPTSLVSIGTFGTGNLGSLGGPNAVAVDPLNRFVFVANSGAGNITAYRIGAGGGLTIIGTYSTSFGVTPEELAIDPSGTFLYTVGIDGVNHNAGAVAAFRITSSGALSGQLGKWIIDSPQSDSLAMDPNGRYLYVSGFVPGADASYHGSLWMFGIQGDGTLSPIDHKTTDSLKWYTALAADPSGRFLFAHKSNIYFALVIDSVEAFLVSSAGLQSLGEVGNAEVETSRTSLTVDPAGHFLYVPAYADQSGATYGSASTFAISPSGALAFQNISFLPISFGDIMTVDPAGKMAFLLNCSFGDCPNVSLFADALNPDGTLTTVGTYPGGVKPISVATTSCTAPLPGEPATPQVLTSVFSSPFVTSTSVVLSSGLNQPTTFTGTLQSMIQTRQFASTCPATTYTAHLMVNAVGVPPGGSALTLHGQTHVSGTTLLGGRFMVPMTLELSPSTATAPNPIAIQSLVTINSNGAPTAVSTPPSNLVSWWQAEGNFADSTGTNPATNGGVVKFAPGRLGQAFDFSFVGDLGIPYVQVPASPTLMLQNVTVMAWVKSAAPPGHDQYIVSQGAKGCFAASYAMYTGSGNLTFYVSDGGNFYEAPDAGPGVWDGNWHFVAGGYDGTAVRLYVDGVQVGNGTPVSTSINYTNMDNDKFYIGAYRGSCDLGFPGQVDEVRVFNRALTAAEIQSIYQTTP